MGKKYCFTVLIIITLFFLFLASCDTGITIEDVNKAMQAMYKEASPVVTKVLDENDGTIEVQNDEETITITGTMDTLIEDTVYTYIDVTKTSNKSRFIHLTKDMIS